MKAHYKKSLKKSITLLLFILVTGSFLLIGGVIYYDTKVSINETFKKTTVLHAERIASHIDTELYANFLKNPSKNDTYEQLRTQLNDYREKIGAMYVYTLDVTNDRKVNIIVDGMATSKDAVDIGSPTTATTFEDVAPTLNGRTSSTGIVQDPDYGNYMSVFVPIKSSSGEVIGVLGVDMEAKIIETVSNEVLINSWPIFLAVLFILLAIILAIVYWYLSKKLNPLSKLTMVTKLISDGDIQEARSQMSLIKVKSLDEIGTLSDSVLNMTTTLEKVMTDIQSHSSHVNQQSYTLNRTSIEVNEAANQIALTMNEVAKAVEYQANSTTSVAEEMDGFSGQIDITTKYGKEVLESSTNIKENTENGSKLMNASLEKMGNIYNNVKSSATKAQELETQTHEVTSLISFISNIANQTNLLALNAAIEAARAGEAGKGFAVVADEVRKLAEEVSTSINTIQTIVGNVKSNSNEMATLLEKGLEDVEEGKESLNQTGVAFNNISSEIYSMNQSISSMYNQLQSISNRQTLIKSSLEDMAAISEENAAGIEQVSASADQMNTSSDLIQREVEALQNMSNQLNELSEVFKV